MKPTEDLKEEHAAIKIMLEILDRVCTDIESGKDVKQEHLEGFVTFMREFVDRCHHTKEENYLFPELEKTEVLEAKDLITSLKKEHEIGRQYVRKIGEAILGEESSKKEVIAENSRAYIGLLTPHIEKENNRLFPMADIYLSQGTQENLLEAFETVEMEIIGPGKHEKFHKWLHSMSEIYLKPE